MNFCTSCGQPRTPGARFCTSCGTPFAADAGAEQAAPPPEPQPAPEQAARAPEPDAPTPPHGMWAPSQGEPPPPQDAPTPGQSPWAQQDAPPTQQAWGPSPDVASTQQQSWTPQQDAWAAQQETWAAPAGAAFAADPETPLGADPNAPDDPFGHLFRGGPAAPAGAEGGFAAPPGPGYGQTAVGQPPYPGGGPYDGGPPGDEPPRRSRARAITLLAGVAVVLVAGGVGAWAAFGGKGHPSAAPTHSAHPASTAPSSSPQPSTSAPSTSAAPSGMVAAAPGVRGKKDEPAVLAFLDDYFTAINTHNYQRYYGLLDAQQQSDVTQGQFDSGYHKTHDSHATLVALGPAGGGITAASVTFTSHQPASGSPSHSSCTSWDTTLYLRHQGSSYVIGAPPASYHASYHAC